MKRSGWPKEKVMAIKSIADFQLPIADLQEGIGLVKFARSFTARLLSITASQIGNWQLEIVNDY